MAESVADRYDRDWLQLGDDRKQRREQGELARYEREYVDPDTDTTVYVVGDNDPA